MRGHEAVRLHDPIPSHDATVTLVCAPSSYLSKQKKQSLLAVESSMLSIVHRFSTISPAVTILSQCLINMMACKLEHGGIILCLMTRGILLV